MEVKINIKPITINSATVGHHFNRITKSILHPHANILLRRSAVWRTDLHQNIRLQFELDQLFVFSMDSPQQKQIFVTNQKIDRLRIEKD